MLCPQPCTCPADVSRHKEVYLLAANYLQSTDWRAAPDNLKQLVAFYSKAGAYESLAAFYESCAEAEIEESRDYGKALQVGTVWGGRRPSEGAHCALRPRGRSHPCGRARV